MTTYSYDIPVQEIDDLCEARRLIAQLRWAVGYLQGYAALAERVAEPADNEFSAVLEEEYAHKLRLLYQQGQLLPGQDPQARLDDLLARLVQDAIDQRWRSAKLA